MRNFDADYLNLIANHPGVRPFLGGSGEIDLTPVISDPNNYCFLGNHGGFVVMNIHGNVYECHTIFHPEQRIRNTLELMKIATEYMFVKTDCVEIVTKIPVFNKAAGWMGGQNHFVEQFKATIQFGPDAPEEVSFRSLSLDRWTLTCSTTGHRGASFWALRPEGPFTAFEHYLGAALSMAKAGNVVKGVNHFNRWAAFQGEEPMVMLSEQPGLIQFRGRMEAF